MNYVALTLVNSEYLCNKQLRMDGLIFEYTYDLGLNIFEILER